VALVAWQGAVGDAAVDDDEAGAGADRLAPEIRPDFGLHDGDDGGLQGAQNAANGEAIVQREVKDAVGEVREFLFGHGAACDGGDRDVKGRLGQGLAQAAEQADGAHGFADADGVEPDGAWRGAAVAAGEEAESFGEMAEVAAVTQNAPGEVGGEQGQAEPLEGAVEPVGQSMEHGLRQCGSPPSVPRRHEGATWRGRAAS
jgi:hypothetical protein